MKTEEENMEQKICFYEETNFKNTTEIGEVPADWEVVKLGEITKAIKGAKPKVLTEDWEKDSIPYLTADYLRSGIYKYFVPRTFLTKTVRVRKDDVVLIWDGSNSGDVFTGVEGILASTMVKILPLTDNLLSLYLYYFLKSKFELFNTKTTGSTIPHVSKSVFQDLPIPLPPLEEQKAIAYVLSTVQEAREKTEKVIEATKELKKSLMQHLFTYGPVSLEEASRINLKETEIGEIPADWEVVKLGEVVTEESPPTEKDPEVSVIPFIPMALIPEDGIFVNSWELRRREDIRSGIQVFEGDLLVAKITPCFENGKQGIVSQLPLPYAYATTEVLRLRARERIILEYVALFLKQGSVRTLLASKMQGTTGRKRLSRHVLKDLPLPLPPLPVQKRIAEILQTVDEKIQAEEKKKQALGNLFNSMLHMLMSGKLRVKFQTSEEGASN